MRADFSSVLRFYPTYNRWKRILMGNNFQNRMISMTDIRRMIPQIEALNIYFRLYHLERNILVSTTRSVDQSAQYIAMVYFENHFCPIINLKMFLKDASSYCKTCKTYVDRDHVCYFACVRCGKKNTAHKLKKSEENIFCENCNKMFGTRVCFDRHKIAYVPFSNKKRFANITSVVRIVEKIT